ncbi:FHA domain-containing protein [Dolichospermum sp. LEGE 00240]|jgi:eukaryotic-like serine/threonine-protein kinase|uniref:protein kinase domain-containing protein n=1 Tax=Dolichospermum sp. LEGE 00240 TaxID=1828603 RepID=UPI00188274EE|nr:protein kinase [Dolichospermum sp. LEGE 00240]MDM3847450.1 FHA domain-containing protein [Aphanizomenon gracile PMC638.10]MDM3850091.1 FHA domain-containing protein [Aphanizomenon gracile PMC627.10]MDM3857591.1 FHA domain-containing protein [Aphanizomenon gracile PMC649.10]MDM3859908.1 FHA domain-containing protein [Aphanizomenon gracile PMC644.10]MBE9247934.1 FHA domain-containing protein [Dolichospermum sp. LEGE 00240]
MPSKIILTITQGKLSRKQYVFESRSTCIVGRNDDCNLQIADKVDMTISRYHCLLDINPPDIRVRDLGSLNGTFVNGKKIGQRQRQQPAQEAVRLSFPEYNLQDGDEIKLGDILFKIGVQVEDQLNKIPDLPVPEENEQQNFLTAAKKLINLSQSGHASLQSISGYSLTKSLGKGDFAEVFAAKDIQTKKSIALKIMLPAVANQKNRIEMFLRATENIKILQHPNIVQLLDYGFVENTFFFTMEYFSGGNVWDFMQRSGWRLPIDIAVDITLQVLDGLIYAHQVEIPYIKSVDGIITKGKGLVHQNLKPNNIFISKINDKIVVKIGDYGLSKAFDLAGLSGQTLTGTKMGTPAFMPRQQVLNFKDELPEIDIWATAACLYNMLTGYFPRNFTGDPWLSVLQNSPVPILQRHHGIPQKLAKVIDLALQEKPQIYFQTAAEFKQALLDCL